jgi:tRNA-Thr(GGU) m(6)t(6)A37 methyltransferase TsaA
MMPREARGHLEISPVGYVRSTLKDRSGAPRQATEGAPPAWLEIDPAFIEALDGLEAGQDIWILTWFHQSDRSVLKVHPRGEERNPLKGVFATRSPDRPNPVGLHRAMILGRDEAGRIQVDALEAIDGTPVIDIKPVLECRPWR